VVAAAVGLLVYLLGAVALAADGLTDSAVASDVVVVLGNKVRADGSPAPRLAARLDAAVAVYEAGLAEHIIVSGGVGRSGYDEATVMAAYLAAAGIDAERIVIDGAGVNTRATAENAAAIMTPVGGSPQSWRRSSSMCHVADWPSNRQESNR